MQQHFAPSKPDVSVVMTVHGAERGLRRALDSLASQKMRNFELLAPCYGADAASVRLLGSMAERDLRILPVVLDDGDAPAALNLALGRARGRYLMFISQDDWLEPGCLASLVQAADDDGLQLAVGGLSLEVGMEGGRGRSIVASCDGESFPTQHDFRSAAWRLFAQGQLLPLAGKLFSHGFVEDAGLSFSPSSLTGHLFVIDSLRDVERVGVAAGVCCHMARTLPRTLRPTEAERGLLRLDAEHDELLGLYRHWGLEGDPASLGMLQSRYVEQLAAFVEALCGWGSGLSSAEQRRQVQQVLSSERAQLAASVAKPESNSARALMVPLRSKNASLVCVQARLMSLLRIGEVADVALDAFV